MGCEIPWLFGVHRLVVLDMRNDCAVYIRLALWSRWLTDSMLYCADESIVRSARRCIQSARCPSAPLSRSLRISLGDTMISGVECVAWAVRSPQTRGQRGRVRATWQERRARRRAGCDRPTTREYTSRRELRSTAACAPVRAVRSRCRRFQPELLSLKGKRPISPMALLRPPGRTI